MSGKNEKNAGKTFTDSQKANDKAINERLKEEKGTDKLDPEDANNAKNRSRQSDTAHKKTGGGKQKNPGM